MRHRRRDAPRAPSIWDRGALSETLLGPGALDVSGSLGESSLLQVVQLVVREACIGETCAALEAREAALAATEPALAELLHGIADDESRHAELAWRFVAWALEREPPRVADVLRGELARERTRLAGLVTRAVSADELAARGLGFVSAAQRAELQRVALSQVVAPCAGGLLGRAAGRQPNNQVLSD